MLVWALYLIDKRQILLSLSIFIAIHLDIFRNIGTDKTTHIIYLSIYELFKDGVVSLLHTMLRNVNPMKNDKCDIKYLELIEYVHLKEYVRIYFRSYYPHNFSSFFEGKGDDKYIHRI